MLVGTSFRTDDPALKLQSFNILYKNGPDFINLFSEGGNITDLQVRLILQHQSHDASIHTRLHLPFCDDLDLLTR
jgi:hypothetical protein